MARRVLHLFADHKITGPAELALETARAVAGRGVEVAFFSRWVGRTETRDRWLQELARERGVAEPTLEGVRLDKHFSPLRALLDARRLARFLRADRPDLIHCHLRNDHLIANYAARWAGGGIPIVRSLYDGELPAPGLRAARTLGGATRRIVCLSRRVAEELGRRASEFGLDPEVVTHLPPPIDIHRFDPERVRPRRADLGVPDGAFCLGIVARMQTHRRYELLLEAVRRLPELHLVVVGRGTNQDTVARGPVQALGLADRVHFTGYVAGEDYVSTLASFDAKVFLVPGSDGTCRAVREALALGVPVVATRRGILPELVEDGRNGRLIDETPESLVEVLEGLAADPERRRELARNARRDAVERFSFERFAEGLEAIYSEVLEKVTHFPGA